MEDEIHSFKGIEILLEDINKMLIRWRAGSVIKHIDLDLFERVVHERVDLERQLMIAMDTITVLSNKVNENEIILKHFNEADRIVMRERIETRLQAEAEQSGEEVHEVRSN